MMPHKKRVLFYCQHLLGIGHVTRSFALVAEIDREFTVDFIMGGPPIQKSAPLGVHVIQLPPLLMEEGTNELYDPHRQRSVEEVFAGRREELRKVAADKSYDFLIVELFPFGRNKFKKEILSLIGEMREVNPKLQVFCSLRDILVKKPDAETRDPKTAALVNEHFQGVFVHSDPDFLRLEETFSATEAIADKLIYTGYVGESNFTVPEALPPRDRKILVSMGGGVVSEELYRALLPIVPQFDGYEFQFVFGPYAPAAFREEFERATLDMPNVFVCDLLDHFERELSRSALSISYGGYNTVMNLLHTRTPALVFPYMANHEQLLRAEKLEQMGFLQVVRDLTPRALTEQIHQGLAARYPKQKLRLSGASFTRKFLHERSEAKAP